MRIQRTAAALLSFLAFGALLSGCTGPPATAGNDRVTLRLLHVDGGPELDPAVDWYAQRVKELSEGELSINVIHSCCGNTSDVEEQLVAQVARAGEDLGWVGTRVFDTMAVKSLQALTAPMLIDSYPLERTVIENKVAAKALMSLDALGVRGLALMPGALRKPLSKAGPLLSPGEWVGEPVVAFHSTLNTKTLEALGALPLDLGFEERDVGLLNGSIQATENTLAFQHLSREAILPYATVNVSLWPRISALIANPDSLSHLSKTHRGVLTQAAADVAARTDELGAMDKAAITSSCQAGARFAAASKGQLAEYERALAPLYAALETDATTKQLLEKIRALKETVDPGPSLVIPDGCGGRATARAAAGTDDVSALAGSFRRGPRSVEELTRAGMPPKDAENAAGTFTFEFTDGRFHLIADWYKGERVECDGSYILDAGRVTVDLVPGDCGPGGEYFSGTFELTADGVRFSDVSAPIASDEVLVDGMWTTVRLSREPSRPAGDWRRRWFRVPAAR